MADIKIAAIMRAGAYSPNHLGNDAAILNAVTEQLRKRGCEVKIYSEERLSNGEVNEDVIIHMCRSSRSIGMLQKLEKEGRLVINSGHGVENCTRERLTRILLGHDIPYPDSLIVETDEAVKSRLAKAKFTRCWIKRGDYAMHMEDVTYVRNPEEAQEVLQEYFLRGIKRAVICRHIEGDLVKFYGVRDSDFFYCFCPFADEGKRISKGIPGHEEPKFDRKELQKLCQTAAEGLDIHIFGGECIVGADGSMTIIDFNDWPSFATCRQEASAAIAKAIISYVKAHNNPTPKE